MISGVMLLALVCSVSYTVLADESVDQDAIIAELRASVEKLTADTAKERDELLESRRNLAAELTTVKESLTSEKASVKKLEDKLKAMTITVDSLGTCESRKEEIATQLSHEKAQCETALKKKDNEAEKKLDRATTSHKAEVEELKAMNRRMSASLAEKAKEDFVFSYAQLQRNFHKIVRFIRCIALHAYDTVARMIPADACSKFHALLAESGITAHYEAATDLVKAKALTIRSHPQVDRGLQMAQQFYKSHVEKQLAEGCQVAKTMTENVRLLVVSQISYTVDDLNKKFSVHVVEPMEQRFPEMHRLLPKSVGDRLLCFAYVAVILLIAIRVLLCILCKTICMCGCMLKMCCPFSCSAKAHASKKGKRRPQSTASSLPSGRKPFQPAATTESNKKSAGSPDKDVRKTKRSHGEN